MAGLESCTQGVGVNMLALAVIGRPHHDHRLESSRKLTAITIVIACRLQFFPFGRKLS
jgi:hypothetical protein